MSRELPRSIKGNMIRTTDDLVDLLRFVLETDESKLDTIEHYESEGYDIESMMTVEECDERVVQVENKYEQQVEEWQLKCKEICESYKVLHNTYKRMLKGGSIAVSTKAKIKKNSDKVIELLGDLEYSFNDDIPF